ncbi:hypothetical protein [Mesorhizobium sp.]|uniref:hypothetical protein n=1 Tax=Mesorhizobium sp. TaxID=1871066 RepID=UPI001207465A|nr:hypothetical protein [Mesorhizobium sp.]TIO26941.1 MAG: hypothetical protein E5X83_06375 [Mesorhizobium sp.]
MTNDLLDELPFMEGFDQVVPLAARLAAYDELERGPLVAITPASASEVKLFASTPAGRMLVEEWGSAGAEMVAMLRGRAARMTDNMSEEDADGFWTWFDTLEPAPAAAIFRQLAG